jgi:tetratricopeptide (TPR) repeat protein
VRRALRALARELGDSRSLSGLRIAADGRRVVVHHEGAQFEPESGQLVLDFSLDALAEQAAKLTRASVGASRSSRGIDDSAARGAGAAGTTTPANRALAERAYAEALALEARDPAAAQRAYRRALARDPAFVEAAVNLARLLHEAGRAKDAVALYQGALARTPDDAEIHYNLALALEDSAGPAAAIAEYERALALDASFADAHWNLAGLLEAAGEKAAALRHYRAYEKLTR